MDSRNVGNQSTNQRSVTRDVRPRNAYYHRGFSVRSHPGNPNVRTLDAYQNPKSDYLRNISITEQGFRQRIFWDVNGMYFLKNYVDVVDEMDNRARGRENDNVDERKKKFCKSVREIVLRIFDDYLREDENCKPASVGKMYLLHRLGRNEEVLSFCQRCTEINGGGKIRHVELLVIDALIALKRFDETEKKLSDVVAQFGKTAETVSVEINFNVAKGDFSKARSLCCEMPVDDRKRASRTKWIDLSEKEYLNISQQCEDETEGACAMPASDSSTDLLQTIDNVEQEMESYELSDVDLFRYNKAAGDYADKKYGTAAILLSGIKKKYKGKKNKDVDELYDECNMKIRDLNKVE